MILMIDFSVESNEMSFIQYDEAATNALFGTWKWFQSSSTHVMGRRGIPRSYAF